ncbi:hypothetical protein ABH15_12030 [Methanoculleus taiwanensis]|uniref:CDP-archaeol synthase n=1 Tax=Methanoculleus taiwanensis TaxID=1550565 RepID=A0A498GZ94_9EURY|nr:CDP-2,3-bis-(O-geranylgeranyl)-sn-glycerol synthase [Methanoculleus taiwanensis]RXE55457.1 hypothetical protein ABH15_12030 [Methanoculleus taiwanensis]
MIPAYVPNSAAALFGGGRPIDFGKTFSDGRRIFGDGKTYRGFIGGVTAGVLAGVAEILLRNLAGWTFLPELTPLSVVLLAAGALLGDLAKSFIKRRLGKDRGEKWPVADQYDLVVGAFVLVLIGNPAWFFETITPAIAIWILILTPLLHRLANIIGYLTGVKDVPW